MKVKDWEKYKSLEYYDHLCACGCNGQIRVKQSHQCDGIPTYINGHNIRINNPMEKEENCKKLSLTRIGKKWSEEVKIKISDSKKGKSGNPHKKETKLKISAALINRKYSLESLEKMSVFRKNKTFVEIMGKPKAILAGAKISQACSGSNNPNWKGGIGQLPYPFKFNNKLKENIRNRDNNTCQLCGKTKEQEGKNLSVHHIDYDKENIEQYNLITLCSSCNIKVNYNREYWQTYFIKINYLFRG